MMNEDKNIDKLFREKLESYSEDPPAFVWEGVMEKLAAGRKRKVAAWYSWSAVAVLLVLAFVAGWYFNDSSQNTLPQTAGKEVVSPADEGEPDVRNLAAEPEAGEGTDDNEQQNAEFLANAASVKPAVKNESTEDKSRLAKETPEKDTREPVTPPEMIKSVEAYVLAFSNNQSEEAIMIEEKSIGLSFYEREIIAQNAALLAEPEQDNKGWQMGVNVSPGYSSYSAKYGNEYASNMTQQAGGGNASMSGGVAFRYRTSKRWSVESGVYYAQNGKQVGSSPQSFKGRAEADYAVVPERLYFNTAVKMVNNNVAMNSIAGIIEIDKLPAGAEIAANLEQSGLYGNSLVTQGEISQVFDLVEIPLYLRYLVVDSKLDVEVLGGVNAGLIVGNHAFLDNQYGVQRIGKTQDVSTTNISGTLGLAFNYALGKHFSLGLEPRFNYYLNSISRNPEVNFRPYRVGLYTGLYYSF